MQNRPPSPRPSVLRPPVRRDDAALWTPGLLRLLGLQLAFGLSFSAFFLLPKFLTLVGAQPAEVGLVMSLWGVAGLLISPLVGSALDRHGRKPFLLAGTILMALAAFGYVFVHTYGPLAVVLRLMQGVAFALTVNGVMAKVADEAPPAQLGQAVGLVGMAGLVTNAAAPAVAEGLADALGWQWVFAASGILGLVALALAMRVREERKPQPVHRSGWTSVLTRSGVRPMAVAVVTSGVGFGAATVFHQPFALHLGMDRVSAFFIAYTCAACVIRLGFGRLAERVGDARLAVASLGLYALVILACAALDALGLWAVGLGLGAAHGAFFPAISAWFMRDAHPWERGRLVSLIYAAFNGGMAVSVVPLGWVAEAHGYPAVFLAAGAVVVAGTGVLARAPRVLGEARVRAPAAASAASATR
jgi:MFS family permease